MANLAFLHTSAAHVATFDRLLATKSPELTARHYVDESLLAECRRSGGISSDLDARITATVQQIAGDGASIIVCTCSSIGGSAEQSSMRFGAEVIRIDRPMFRMAVSAGERIGLIAALPDALPAGKMLLLEESNTAGKPVVIVDILCAGAWEMFESGDFANYYDCIAKCADSLEDKVDVIVLAQASMAPAAQLRAHLRVPILTSPHLAVDAAVTLLSH